jgi:hypothetical protein
LSFASRTRQIYFKQPIFMPAIGEARLLQWNVIIPLTKIAAEFATESTPAITKTHA